jgi:nucleoside-diphosphate-sugar epimerase
MNTRRRFLKQTALAGAAATAGPGSVFLPGFGTDQPDSPGPQSGGRAKRMLILGGTGFIGPHMVEYALSRGHEVTLFNRGRTNTHLFPNVEKLVGDRSDDLSSLEGREWDVVIDNNATLPRWVRQSAQLLKEAAGQYIHVSTISVYESADYTLADGSVAAPGSADEEAHRIHEDSPLAQLPVDHDGSEAVTGQTYGPFKWMAEAEAREAFGERATIVRPGLIVGPLDPTDRFTYWPVRIDRGGDVLAPGDGKDAVQVIDARDLSAWIVRLAESGTGGTFNGAGPGTRLSMSEMLSGIRAATSAPVNLHWVPADFLTDHEVFGWSQMPAWIPRNPLTFVRNERAVAAGLTFRPLAETARDTIDWNAERPAETLAAPRAGLDADREAEVLAAWRARKK